MRHSFAWAFGVTFGLCLVRPLAAIFLIGADAVDLLRNDPAYSVFLLIVLPSAVGSFAVAYQPQVVEQLSGAWRRGLLCFVVIAGVATAGAMDDVQQEPMNPLFLRNSMRLPAPTSA